MSRSTFNIAPLSSYRSKIVGAVIVVAALVAEVVANAILKLGVELYVSYAVIFGLCLLVFSQEKRETPRTAEARSRALRLMTMVAFATLLAFSFVSEHHHFTIEGNIIVMLLMICLVLYLLVFYGMLLLPRDLSDDNNVIENFKANRKFYICYIVVVLQVVLYLAFSFFIDLK